MCVVNELFINNLSTHLLTCLLLLTILLPLYSVLSGTLGLFVSGSQCFQSRIFYSLKRNNLFSIIDPFHVSSTEGLETSDLSSLTKETLFIPPSLPFLVLINLKFVVIIIVTLFFTRFLIISPFLYHTFFFFVVVCVRLVWMELLLRTQVKKKKEFLVSFGNII